MTSGLNSLRGCKHICAVSESVKANWTYWGLFKNFVWYKYASMIEDTHPMICGFFRLKDRTDRRPGCAIDSRWVHARKRAIEIARVVRGCVSLYFEMQEVWLATRGRAQFQANIEELRRRYEGLREMLGESTSKAGHAIGVKVDAVRSGAGDALAKAGTAGRQAAENISGHLTRLREQHHPRLSRWSVRLGRLNPLTVHTVTRRPLNDYWRQTWDKLRRGRIFQINPIALTWNFLRDVHLCTIFSISFFGGYGR